MRAAFIARMSHCLFLFCYPLGRCEVQNLPQPAIFLVEGALQGNQSAARSCILTAAGSTGDRPGRQTLVLSTAIVLPRHQCAATSACQAGSARLATRLFCSGQSCSSVEFGSAFSMSQRKIHYCFPCDLQKYNGWCNARYLDAKPDPAEPLTFSPDIWSLGSSRSP